MIVVDTNLLVYAHREESEWHTIAKACLVDLANSGNPWAIAWSSLHEFLAIVTHPRIYSPPTPRTTAFAAICLNHGIAMLWTADRDFSLFPELKTRNPLLPT